MEINPFIQLIRPATQNTTPAEVRNWQVGQILNAVTTSRTEQGQVTLQIGSQTLTAQVQVELSAGQQLKLEVVKLGDLPLLRLTETPPPPANKTVDHAIRDALPRQESYSPLLANLSLLASSKARALLPSNISRVIQLFFKSIPTAQKLSTPKGVQQAFRDSGLFLEAKLGSQANTGRSISISHDFKAGLLKLQEALKQLEATSKNIASRPEAGDNKTANIINRNISSQAPGRATPATNLAPGTQTQSSLAGTQINLSPGTSQAQARGSQPLPSAVLQGSGQNSSETNNINPSNLSKEQLAKVKDAALSNDTTRARGVPAENTDKKNIDPAHLARAAKLGATATQGDSRPLAPALAGGLAQASLNAQGTAKQSLEALIASELKQVLEPPMKHTNPQAQARVAASLLSQDGLHRWISTLLSETESSLARLQLTQLATHSTESEQKQVWLFDLPVRKDEGADIFHMRIEKDSGSSREERPADESFWSIKIAFSLEGLGPVYAKIAVLGHENVSTTLWAEQEQTVALFNQHITDLQGNLEKAGLCIDKLSCLHGKPADDEPIHNKQILDEKA
jgi:hypothetical protein